MRLAVWGTRRQNRPQRPPLFPIGVTSRKEPSDSPIKYYGTFFNHAGPNYLSKHRGVHRVLNLRVRYNAMMEEVKVPMETAEGSLLPDQITAGTKVAGELNQMVDEMIEELEHKLGAVSAEIMAKMDDMSRRLDNLEASIHAQNNQAANPS